MVNDIAFRQRFAIKEDETAIRYGEVDDFKSAVDRRSRDDALEILEDYNHL